MFDITDSERSRSFSATGMDMANEKEPLTIKVRDDFYEERQHGTLDFPVEIYKTDLNKMYLGLVGWHRHGEVEFILVTEGKACFYSDDTSFVLEKGQGLFINHNVLHSVKALQNIDCHYYSIVFHPAFIFSYNHSSLSTNYLLPVTNHPSLRHLLLDPSDEKLERLLRILEQIIAADEEKAFGYELRIKGLFIDAWLVLIEQIPFLFDVHKPSVKEQISLDEDRIKEAIAYISEHFSDPITLQDIAGSIHLSKSECCRCFKRCLHTTPFEFLTRYRIYSAINLINRDTEGLSISEIALQTGFNSSSYFNKQFKKYTGCTPSDLRGRIKGHPENLELLLARYIDSQNMAYFESILHK